MQKLDSGPIPDSSLIWKEFGVTMRTVSGHNDRNRNYRSYWEDTEPVEWPKEVTFKVPTEQRWPAYRRLVAAYVTPADMTSYDLMSWSWSGHDFCIGSQMGRFRGKATKLPY